MSKRKLNKSYIAGFFDGEGCISLSLKGLRLILTNTDKLILEEIQRYFGDLGQVTSKLRYKNDNFRKPCFQLIYWNKHAEEVLVILRPYLRQKKEQARLALQFQRTYRNRVKGMKMKKRILIRRKFLIDKVREVKWLDA